MPVYLLALLLLPAFEGTWAFHFNGQAVLQLTVTSKDGHYTGALTRPKDLSINQDGDVEQLGGDPITLPIERAELKANRLTLTIDDTPFVMTLNGDSHATLAIEGMRPWPLDRVPAGKTVALATKLAARTYFPEIQTLRRQLKEMVKADQEARLAFDEARYEAVDAKNKPELVRIFDRYGWVTRTLAGNDAAHDFWLLVQHQTPDLQQRFLPALEKAAKANDASASDHAYLYDRVQVGLGKPQRWGTQTKCVDGKAELSPVEDPANLDARRQELYLMPIADYLKADYIVQTCLHAKLTPISNR
ncbi:MAG: DUF6624 domain-containing protein [Bryobacteraceae bacterium]